MKHVDEPIVIDKSWLLPPMHDYYIVKLLAINAPHNQLTKFIEAIIDNLNTGPSNRHMNLLEYKLVFGVCLDLFNYWYECL